MKLSIFSRSAICFVVVAVAISLSSAGYMRPPIWVVPMEAEADDAERLAVSIEKSGPVRDSAILAFMEKAWSQRQIPDEVLLGGAIESVDKELSHDRLSLEVIRPHLERSRYFKDGLRVAGYGAGDAIFYRDENGIRLIGLEDKYFVYDTIILSKVSTQEARLIEFNLGLLESDSGIYLGMPGELLRETLCRPSMESKSDEYEILWYFGKPEVVVNKDNAQDVIWKSGNIAAYALQEDKVVEIYLHYWSRLDDSQRAKKVCPVIHGNLLLGGTIDGKWTRDEYIAPYIQGGEKYRVYSPTTFLGEAIGSRARAMSRPFNYTYDVEFKSVYKNNEPLKSLGGVIAIGGSWDALPRRPEELSTNAAVYKKAVQEILEEKNVENPNINITQLMRVDLEGDGIDEVIFSATNERELGMTFVPQSNGYSFVALRKLVGGEPVTFVLTEEFFDKEFAVDEQHEYPYAEINTIAAVLDLDGEGTMEIITYSRAIEGFYYGVYDVSGDKVEHICGSGLGV